MKLVVESSTPGMRTLPSGSLTCSNSFHSCAWRGLAPSKEIPFYKCLDGKGDHLDQVSGWVSSLAGGSLEGAPFAAAIAKACGVSLSPDWFFLSVSQYRTRPESFNYGYSVGFYDGVSLVAKTTDDSGMNARIASLAACLKERGSIDLGHLQSWIDSVVDTAAQTGADKRPAVDVIAEACNLQ